MTAPYCPTDQQKTVIIHDRSAFVTACPGAGKTRTMVERARHLADRTDDKRGVAFLSFTNAAVDELQGRLRLFGLLPSPLFPSFIGTFDGMDGLCSCLGSANLAVVDLRNSGATSQWKSLQSVWISPRMSFNFTV